MNFKNYTIKSQESIQKAMDIAAANQQQGIETGHILKGILETDESVVSFVFKKLGVNENHVKTVLNKKNGGVKTPLTKGNK